MWFTRLDFGSSNQIILVNRIPIVIGIICWLGLRPVLIVQLTSACFCGGAVL